MNPSNPTTTEMQQVEQMFFEQMRQMTKKATSPSMAHMRSFDLQFSDRWIGAP
jgi:hypothetical protein